MRTRSDLRVGLSAARLSRLYRPDSGAVGHGQGADRKPDCAWWRRIRLPGVVQPGKRPSHYTPSWPGAASPVVARVIPQKPGSECGPPPRAPLAAPMALLPDADSFKRLADGTTSGPAATCLRAGLTPAAALLRGVMDLRNIAYDRGWLATHAAPVPVVCVGNLTLGGTGKTPLVAWVVRQLIAGGHRPAIVSRGYAAEPGTISDEAAELAVILPGVRHIANRDRVAGARAAAHLGADCVVLDDGFQHRRLARDLDLVAIDATDPFGCDHVFPRGLLRERIEGLSRADAAILTRAGMVSPERRDEIRQRFIKACGGRMPQVWAEASHAPVAVRTGTGESMPLDWLRHRRVAAFAGIGNPSAFRDTLERLAGEVVGFRPFPDHHAYSAADAREIADWATHLGADALVATLKDLVKISPGHLPEMPLVAVEIALVVDSGEQSLSRLLRRIAPPSPDRSSCQ